MKVCKLPLPLVRQLLQQYDHNHFCTFDDYMFEKFGLKYIDVLFKHDDDLIFEIVCEKKYLLFLLKMSHTDV